MVSLNSAEEESLLCKTSILFERIGGETMRNWKNRVIASLLVLCTLATMTILPGTALAASTWSQWSTTPVYQSDTREVETRQVKISDSHTEYRYGRYIDKTKKYVCWCATYQASVGTPGSTLQYSDWSTTRYSANDTHWTCGYCKGSHTGVAYTTSDGRDWWNEYTLSSGNYFWEESRTVAAKYETQYRYRDIEPTPAVYTVSFDANGGSLGSVVKTVTAGSPYGELPTPTRDGYTFDGWYTSATGGERITAASTVERTAGHTLYAHWTGAVQSYTVSFDANGGSVSPSGKTVIQGEPYGTLPTPTRSGYDFDGWYISSSGGTQITASTVVERTANHTLYAHWTSTVDPYNLGDETYSFANYGDSDSAGGHCFGMSITSAGYHNNLLDIGRIGGNANTPLYSFRATSTVKQPICHYQGIQGSYASRATVAGGSFYLTGRYDIASDWREVVNYVKNHSYDETGLLQIGFRKNRGGHAINFLRYENVNGQDRIYAYDNNFPTQETYFYRDSSGAVRQAPVQTFSGAIDCIALRDCRTYFNSAGDFDATHALYMAKDAASVEGDYPYSYMEAAFSDEDYVMYELPANVDRVVIIPHSDNASFIYMEEEYSFGNVTDETRGELKLATEGAVDTEPSFRTYEDDSVAAISFADVPAGSWYYDAVQWAVEQGITNGTGVNPATFSPDNICSQVQILTFLWRAAGEPGSTVQLPFTLRSELAYAQGALCWAYENGMIDASFDQTALCSRWVTVKFIWQAFGSPIVSPYASFTDVPVTADYAEAVNWAAAEGVATGTSVTNFTPYSTVTRKEAVTFLYRAYRQ